MNLPILNRAFQIPSDGWYQIAARGEYAHPSGLMQVLDEAAITAMCNRFAEESKSANFGGLLVDFDHCSYDSSKSSEAAGWVTALQNRDDGLWGQIRWTTTGKQAVTGGEFRLVSPAWKLPDTQIISGNRIRPMRLDSVGLTNKPNIRGMAPLSNREEKAVLEITETKPQINTMDILLKVLGLAAGSSEAVAVTAAEALTNRAISADAELDTLKNRMATLDAELLTANAVNKKLTDAQIDNDLTRYGNRFAANARPNWQAALLANREGTIALLESLTPVTTTSPGSAQVILNRAGGNTPPAEQDFKALVSAHVAKEKCSKSAAFDVIKNSNPGSFKAWQEAGCGSL